LNPGGFFEQKWFFLEWKAFVLYNAKHANHYRLSGGPLPMKPAQLNDRDCAEKTLREATSMSIFCHAHPLTSLRNILRKQNVVTTSNLRRMPSGETVRVSGMLILVHTVIFHNLWRETE
jgi:hypothetical protein